MIAKALAQETPIIFLDEPTAFLDYPSKVEIMQLLYRLIQTTEKTIFLSTHDLDLALEIAEFTTLDSQSDVKNYAITIAEFFQKHHKEIDEIIQKYSKNWDIQRLVKMDKDILRIAIVELLYVKDAPMKVVVDEALELAKKYSTDDSAAFINGILAKVIVDYGIK